MNFKKGSQLPKYSNTNDMIASKYLALTYKHINQFNFKVTFTYWNILWGIPCETDITLHFIQ